MDRVLDDILAEVIRFAVHNASLHTAPGHPHREATRMMIAAVVVFRKAAWAVDRASEFASSDD